MAVLSWTSHPSCRIPCVSPIVYCPLNKPSFLFSMTSTRVVWAATHSLISMFRHTCFRLLIVPVALRILLLISSEQLLSHVKRLPKYSNFSTFSIVSPPICIFCSMFRSPSIIVFVFGMFRCSPVFSSACLISSPCSWSVSQYSCNRSISSANLRLLSRLPPMLTPVGWLSVDLL